MTTTMRLGSVLCIVIGLGIDPVKAQDETHTLQVTGGLQPYQVLQCDTGGTTSVSLRGTTDVNEPATVQVRVQPQNRVGFWRWIDAGTSEDGKWTAEVYDIPAGGPYRVEIRLRVDGDEVARAAVEHVLVGDLWILAGQSNMQGVGNNVNVEQPSEEVHVFAMNDEWRIAEEPLHRLGESRDIVHSGVEDDEARNNLLLDVTGWTKGAGLGLSFAKHMVRESDRPVGLIPCAHGGTSMTQWDPKLRDEGGKSLYGAMYRRFLAAGGKVRGVLWYQGESDANPDDAPRFLGRFLAFIQAVRSDFNAPDLPFYYVQIGRFVTEGDPVFWNTIQVMQLQAEDLVPNSGMVASIDLPLDDNIHIGTDGLRVLGNRLARLVRRDLYEADDLHRGPSLKGIERADTPYGPQLRVSFDTVNGRLESNGPVSGFSLADPQGNDLHAVYRQELDSDEPATVVLWVDKVDEGAQIWYGKGLNPRCTLTDSIGMALPVFGPVDVLDTLATEPEAAPQAESEG